MDLLPNVESYASHPLPEDPDATFDEFGADGLEICGVSEWLSDVTKVVDALFEEGLATDENLALLFGRRGYLSYRIYKLQQEREEQMWLYISPFIVGEQNLESGKHC